MAQEWPNYLGSQGQIEKGIPESKEATIEFALS